MKQKASKKRKLIAFNREMKNGTHFTVAIAGKAGRYKVLNC